MIIKTKMKKIISNVLGLAVILGVLAPVFSVFAGSAVFNNDPQDKATLRVSNYTANPGSNVNWTPSISGVNVGDVISFIFYYHNTSQFTATNTKLRLSFNYSGGSISANGAISADNASAVNGSVNVVPTAGQTLTGLTFNSVFFYPNQDSNNPDPLPFGQNGSEVTASGVNIGNIDGGWPTQGYLVVRFSTQGTTGGGGGGTSNSSCSGISTPATVTAGQTFSATVSMKNTGTTSWTPGSSNGYFLGSQNPQDNQRWGVGRVSLTNTVSPGQTVTFTFDAVAPQTIGSQPFDWKMVHENVEWFGATCTKTINVQSVVIPPPTLSCSPVNQTANVNQTVSFSATGGTGSYSWTTSPYGSPFQGSGSNFSTSYGTSGSKTVTVTSGNQTANCYVSVNTPATPTLTITPSSNSVQVGQSVNFQAQYDPDGSTGAQSSYDITGSANWNSSNMNIASLGWNKGQFAGIANGTVTVSAIYGGLTANATLTVMGGGSGGSQPTVQTNAATGISQNSAILNGQVNPNGYSTSYWFEYGTSQSLGYATFGQSLGSGNSNQNVNANISGLLPNTTYYFRIAAQNQYNTSYGLILSFTTNNNGGGGGSATLTITPANYSVSVGAYATFQARYDADGASGSQTEQDVTWSANWISNNPNIASSQSNRGQFLGVSQGNASISANYNGLTAYANLNVYGGGGNGCNNQPNIQTSPASNIQNNYATVNGQVNSNNCNTSYWFEYGTTQSLGYTSGFQSVGNSNGWQTISSSLSGLNYNTTYYFRAVAQNQSGTVYGTILNFTTNNNGGGTGNVPYVQTLNPTGTTQNTANFNSTVTPNDSSATAWFEYGINYNSLYYTSNNVYVSSYNLNVNSYVSNLSPGTTYYVRAVARNSYGIGYGQVLSFTTSGNYNNGSMPLAITKSANYISRNSALLNGSVNPNGGVATSWFEYGPTVSLGLRTVSQPVGSVIGYVNISNTLTGLVPSTTYYFRAVVQNSYGTSYGEILNFRTLSAVIVNPPIVQGTSTVVVINDVVQSCFVLMPTVADGSVKQGEEFEYSLVYRNNCKYDLNNVVLRVVVPLETTFISSNYPISAREGNTITFNVGQVPKDYQATVVIKNSLTGNVKVGDTIMYGTTGTYNDDKGKFNSVSVYVTALVEAVKSNGGFANIVSFFRDFGWGWLWLLILLILLLIIYWIFFRERKKETAVSKIEKSIS